MDNLGECVWYLTQRYEKYYIYANKTPSNIRQKGKIETAVDKMVLINEDCSRDANRYLQICKKKRTFAPAFEKRTRHCADDKCSDVVTRAILHCCDCLTVICQPNRKW
jgi:hypothetical protein